jgi:hypothetical protein
MDEVARGGSKSRVDAYVTDSSCTQASSFPSSDVSSYPLSFCMRCKLMTSSYSLMCSCVMWLFFSVAYSPSSVSPAMGHIVDRIGLIRGDYCHHH